jgi:tRNA A37 threonylcarbamoyladenosine biosynthesis protein TsaE
MEIHASGQIVLTLQQEQVFSELKKFLESSDYDCFILKGYAGTGKTFLMGQLIDYLNRRHRNYVLMAPTGRAAKILSRKTNGTARTIHSTIYKYSESETLAALRKKKTAVQDSTPGLFEDDMEEVVLKFRLWSNNNPVDTVYIVDEASMVADHSTPVADLVFGSGALLQDLLTFVGHAKSEVRTVESRFKLIFVGDPAQLPPVGANHSPALDAQYLATKHEVRVFVGTELTGVVRQKADSGILKNAQSLRSQIDEQRFYKLILEPAPDLQPRSSETFLQSYFKQCTSPKDFASIVVGHSNRLVQAYNRQIRGHFFPGQPDLQPGDRLVVMKNSYIRTRNPDTGGDETILVLNGTMLTVFQ